MKKISFYLGLALAAFLGSCSDDNFQGTVENPVQTGDEILFGSTLSGDADVIDLGIRYSTIVFLFATINTLNLAYEKIFQGVGKMKITMIWSAVFPISFLIRC